MDAEIKILSDALIGEIFNALGLSKSGLAYQTFGELFRKPAIRLATIGVTADRMIVSDGFSKAATWMLTNWCSNVTARGTETIPRQGPLLVISNHAGTYDTIVIASQLSREDLKLISSNISFLKNLPNANTHIFFLTNKIQDRVSATRAGMRHLQDGHSLLLYGTGLVDPDLEVYPDAEKYIDRWSPSIDLFLRKVPETQVLVTIVSGVVAKRWAHHPITWLRHIDWQKRRLAEFGQVIQQLLFPGSFYLQPHISFAPPVCVDELRRESNTDRMLPAVIARAKKLMTEHRNWIRSTSL